MGVESSPCLKASPNSCLFWEAPLMETDPFNWGGAGGKSNELPERWSESIEWGRVAEGCDTGRWDIGFWEGPKMSLEEGYVEEGKVSGKVGLGCRERLGYEANEVDVLNGAGAKLPLGLDEKLIVSASVEDSEKSEVGRPMLVMLLYIEWVVLFCRRSGLCWDDVS